MVFDISGIFFEYLTLQTYMGLFLVYIASFVIKELILNSKILREKYLSEYNENSKVASRVLFVFGLIISGYGILSGKIENILSFIRLAGIVVPVAMISLSAVAIAIIIVGKKIFQKVDNYEKFDFLILHICLDILNLAFLLTLALITLPIAIGLWLGKA